MDSFIKGFHGGDGKILLRDGLKRTIDTRIGDGAMPYAELLVYLTTDFFEAADYVHGVDGVVVEVKVPKSWVYFTEKHHGTWYLLDHAVPPSMITGVWDTGGQPWPYWEGWGFGKVNVKRA